MTSYLNLPDTEVRDRTRERDSKRLASRALAILNFAAAAFAPAWALLIGSLDAFALGMSALALLLGGLSWLLGHPRVPKAAFFVIIAVASASIVMQALQYGQSYAGYFLLGPGMIAAVFFWRNTRFVVLAMTMLTGAFVAIPLAVEGGEGIARAVMTTPIFLALMVAVGWLGAETSEMQVEKTRFKSTISSLLVALQERDGYTADHSEETVDLAMAVASELELEEEQRSVLADVALLHDIGKIGIPNEILNKPYGLDEREWAFMKKHPEIGERIVAPVPGFAAVAKAIRHEHERWDGLGYPDGISGEEIPIASRVVLVCDAFHAMITDRPYRKSIGIRQARCELMQNAGSQFDPAVVDALLTVIDRGEVPESVGKAAYVGPTNMPQHQAAAAG